MQGGYGWGAESDDLSFTPIDITADHFTANSLFGGAHIGYDQQFGSLVIGARAELDGFDLHGSKTATSPGDGGAICNFEGCTVALSFHNTWQAFLLARAGVAFDRWLVYVTGGLALGDDRESATITQTYRRRDAMVGIANPDPHRRGDRPRARNTHSTLIGASARNGATSTSPRRRAFRRTASLTKPASPRTWPSSSLSYGF